MKPVIIKCGREVHMFSRPRSVISTGRQLQVIYETGRIRGGWGIETESHSFNWPWMVLIGIDSEGAGEETEVF